MFVIFEVSKVKLMRTDGYNKCYGSTGVSIKRLDFRLKLMIKACCKFGTIEYINLTLNVSNEINISKHCNQN